MENAETQKIREAFGVVLRKKRKEQGYSQEELAHRAGITMRYVSLLEGNKRQPTISTLYLLCKALEISMAEFVSEIEKENAQQ
jgi:transcriptional regulator with XRE-family HTH domain